MKWFPCVAFNITICLGLCHHVTLDKTFLQIVSLHPGVRGGSRNFWEGGLYTIVVTFNANGVEGELLPRASGTSS